MSDELPPQAYLVKIVTGSVLSQAVYAAAELGVADQLHDGAKTASQLAAAVGAHRDALGRLMRLLVGLGVFAENEGRYALTPVSEHLRSNAPQSLRSMVLMMGSPWRLRAWEQIVHSIKTGQSAFNAVHGEGPFEYFRRDPKAAAIFNDAMVSYTSSIAPAIAAAYDFSGYRTVVDIGGGHGYLLATILKANPTLAGMLFDLPEVVKGAPALLAEHGVATRCEVVAGSFFESVVPGGDVYIMKQIIHDWNDEQALTVLRNCRRALKPAARLLLIENVVPPGNGPDYAKQLDLEVLVALGGRERTEVEYRDLYEATGFRLERVIPTQAGIHLIEGIAQ
jgi:SAM-dependent methyltransferase